MKGGGLFSSSETTAQGSEVLINIKYKEEEMMKKVLVTIAGMLLLSSPAMAIEIP